MCIGVWYELAMQNPTEAATDVEAAVNQMSAVQEAKLQGFESTDEGIELTLSISSAVDEGQDDAADPSNSSAVDGGQDEAGFEFDNVESPSNSSAVEEMEQTEEGDFICPLCGDYEGSKAQVNGHKGHCSPSNSSAVDEGTEDDDNDTSSSNSSAVDNEEVTDDFLLQNGVAAKNLKAVKKYRSKNGVCQKEGCEHGASSEDEEFCASHRGSSSNSSAVEEERDEKSYDNLTEGQKAAAQDLLTSGEVESLEEAVQMV